MPLIGVGSQGPSARVFISCGQARGSDEERIATAVEERLRKLGFDPYVAVAQQSLRGVTENIFGQLAKSEYFIFVDFKREKLDVTPISYRGSLFAHQELAIASFLALRFWHFKSMELKRTMAMPRWQVKGPTLPGQKGSHLPTFLLDYDCAVATRRKQRRGAASCRAHQPTIALRTR